MTGRSEMPDFSKAKIGDKCFHLRWGECEITKIDKNKIKLNLDYGWIYMDGRKYPEDAVPICYHSRPEISDPPPLEAERLVDYIEE
jgi:hypothetical protein